MCNKVDKFAVPWKVMTPQLLMQII